MQSGDIVGQHGIQHDVVQLHRSKDFELLEEFNRKDFQYREDEELWKMWTRLLGIDYIDTNTWYYIEQVDKKLIGMPIKSKNLDDRRDEEIVIHIRSIDPPREIYTHTFPNESSSGTFSSVANENYVLYTETKIFNWRTEENRSRIPGWYGFAMLTDTDAIALTHDGRVLVNVNASTVVSDPFGGKKTEDYPFVSALTPDERYLIALERNGDCALRLFEEKREIARCGTGHPFGIGIKKRAVAISPDSKMFAMSINDKVRLYRIDPFRLEQTVIAPGNVATLALSDDGRLASGDNDGRIRVWDIASGKLIGKFDKRLWQIFSLVFQPGGNILVGWGKDFFELPPRPAASTAQPERTAREKP
ncbi:MAG: hypothetical protein LBL48_06345 [Azoarcus sp.]|nr:hypothetical protein [Azoarcus sp.]